MQASHLYALWKASILHVADIVDNALRGLISPSGWLIRLRIAAI